MPNTVIRLHYHAGQIWSEGDHQPLTSYSWDSSVDRQRLAASLPRGVAVRVLGFRGNAKLILWLLGFLPRGALQLGTPGICPARVRHEPGTILQLMRGLSLPPSAGGWRVAEPIDQRAYELTVRVDDQIFDLPVFQRHPAWVAATYPRGRELVVITELLATIVDPRWYINPARFERLSRLYMWLGLTPLVFHRILAHGPGKDVLDQRAWLALRAWRGPAAAENPAVWRDNRPDDWAGNPRHFLWRHAASYRDPVQGLLRATQRYVALVRQYWLDQLRPAYQTCPWFLPEQFFKRQDEAEDFVAFVRRERGAV